MGKYKQTREATLMKITPSHADGIQQMESEITAWKLNGSHQQWH